ncbi:Xaa-Pro peptidase family protein [Oricola sp.]|uniref:M24 family metallopeptidase n=1 Tax=Oricola sp. TaxID=1979950 RepID=UPI0025DABB26|nr:Xaa-Pro peptidase family protein [Oricola sp.]MCI5076909.1 Xaa-Pro peptidase family protein [Oricola sp.]
MALEQDREIFSVAEHTEHVTFQPTTRRAASGFELPMIVHDRLPFTPEEYVRRYDIVQAAMAEMDLDALLIRGPENITYFTGYETPGYYKYHCIIVPKDGEPVFLVRDFEWINTPEFAWSTRIAKVFDWDHPPSVTVNVLQQLGLAGACRIGVEKQTFFYTVDEHETLLRNLPENTFVDATQIMWNARMIKSDEEIAVMRKSAHLVDLAMQAGWDATRPGASGDEINAVVNKTLFENGGEYMGLPPFVLAGERSCLPHQTGGSNRLADNDLMYFEISASQHRYTAALMRTIFVGTPKDEWVRAAEACIGAVEAALETIKPGVTPHEADTAARAVTQKAGFGEYHRNRLGYSIGVSYPPDWGEGEIISLRQDELRPLQKGMTFHMPPLCLKYREYGIGFSESIVVTENGCERLSNLSRQVIVK